jgi:hypothetical protein
MIIHGTWMREEEPLTTSSFVGIIVRVAQMLGLNRDPSSFQIPMSAVLAEVRRRVWWHVFYIDTSIAVAAGLSPLIDRESWDVRPLSELRDDFIGTPTGLQYEKSVRDGTIDPSSCDDIGSLVGSEGIFICGKLDSSRKYEQPSCFTDIHMAQFPLLSADHDHLVTARELLNRSFRFPNSIVEDINQMQINLQNLRNRLWARISRLRRDVHGGSYEDDATFNAWARLLLSVLADQYWWFLVSPLLSELDEPDLSEVYPQ